MKLAWTPAAMVMPALVTIAFAEDFTHREHRDFSNMKPSAITELMVV